MHPYILESSAFGVPSGYENEEIKICVELQNKNGLSHKDLFNYFNNNLAYYMVPRYIEFKENLSKTATEQINKNTLKKEWNDLDTKKKTWDAKTGKFCII